MKRFLKAAFAASVLTLSSLAAHAASLSFTGNLAGDNAVQFFNFTLTADSDVTLRTWSYAGGTNAAGASISAGGFDTVVSLFFGTGPEALLFSANDDGFGVAIDPVTGEAADSLLEAFALPSGTYTVALTQFANFANGPTLGDGFPGFGNSGFDGRTAAWALDILGVTTATAIPEPNTVALALFGLGAAFASMAAARNQRGRRRLNH